MTTEHDALWRLQRDLEAERRHTVPSRIEHRRTVTDSGDRPVVKASADVIAELCDAVAGPMNRRSS